MAGITMPIQAKPQTVGEGNDQIMPSVVDEHIIKQDPLAGSRRIKVVHESGVQYYVRILPNGSRVPENPDIYRVAMEQDKRWDDEQAKKQAEQQSAAEMQQSARNIGQYSRGVAMMKQAQENPQVTELMQYSQQNPNADYLTAPREDIPKIANAQVLSEMQQKGTLPSGIKDIAAGRELLDKYGNKMAYAAEQGLLDTKNPYSQKVFDAAVGELNPGGAMGKGFAAAYLAYDTPENRKKNEESIALRLRDKLIDENEAQILLNENQGIGVYKVAEKLGINALAESGSLLSGRGKYRAAEETQNTPLGGMAYKDVQKLKQTVTDKINALDRPKSTAVGMAGNNNIRADRSLAILDNPKSSAADLALATADLLYIMQGGVPLAEQVRTGVEKTLGQDVTNWYSYVSSDPKAFDNPRVKDQLRMVIDGVKAVDNRIISDNISIEAPTFQDLINKYPDWWAQTVSAIMATTNPYAKPSAEIPGMKPKSRGIPKGSPSAGTPPSSFVEGKIYKDAKGNKAIYKNGKFVEIK